VIVGTAVLDRSGPRHIVNAMVNQIVDGALAGLADPTRRAIIGMLSDGPLAAGEVAAAFPVSKPAISRHLRILREAGLVVEQRGREDGRRRVYRLRREPFDQLGGWLDEVGRFWQRQLEAFRDAAVEEARRKGMT
jgi:DNA-binding transcriptional ArsR family regulator